MGLDQELRRYTRLDETELGLLNKCEWMSELRDAFSGLDVGWRCDAEIDVQTDILPYMTIVTLRDMDTPIADVVKKLGLPEGARPNYYYGNISFGFSQELTHEYKLKDEYTWEEFKDLEKEISVRVGVTHSEELRYWRKEYELHEALVAASDNRVKNCFNCHLNAKMKKVIKKWFKENELECPDLEDTEDSIVCYWNWY